MRKDATDLNSEVILVTGAAGSIGRELVFNFASQNSKLLILVDISETGLFHVIEALRQNYPKTNYRYFTESICNAAFLDFLFKKYAITSVFHAAAYKHVAMMEENRCVAITTNVYGAQLLIDKALMNAVNRFIFVSTDKAVAPVSVMGRTKKVVEEYLIFKQKKRTNTQIAVLRLCNVYGSSGSVVPVFEKRIASNLPLEIKGTGVKRAFISVDAIKPIANWLLTTANCTGIFIPKNVEVATIYEVAQHVLKGSGVTSPQDYPITLLELPSFEKEEESLKSNTEQEVDLGVSPLIKIEQSVSQEFNLELLKKCLLAAKSYNEEDALAMLKKLSS